VTTGGIAHAGAQRFLGERQVPVLLKPFELTALLEGVEREAALVCGGFSMTPYTPPLRPAPGLPASQPSRPAGFGRFVMSTSANRAPATPAGPWQENTSSESASRAVARVWIAVIAHERPESTHRERSQHRSGALGEA
jgi:hypothetical protein